jgi:hypothetical protein
MSDQNSLMSLIVAFMVAAIILYVGLNMDNMFSWAFILAGIFGIGLTVLAGYKLIFA